LPDLDKILDQGLIELALGNPDGAVALWQSVVQKDAEHARAIDFLQTVGALPLGDGSAAMDEVVWESDSSLPLLSLDELAEADAGPDGLPVTTGEPPRVPSGEFEVVDRGSSTASGTWASGRYEAVPPDPDSLMALAQSQFDRMEFEESLYNCEEVVRRFPERQDASALAQRNRDFLLDRYGQYIGDLSQIPILLIDGEALDDLSMDSNQAHILNSIDGVTSLEGVRRAGPQIDTFQFYRTLHFLLENRILALQPA